VLLRVTVILAGAGDSRIDRTALVAQLNSIDFQHISAQHAYCLCFSASHFNHSCAPACVAYLDPNEPFPTLVSMSNCHPDCLTVQMEQR
jgi:hypothetical protein